MKGDGVEFEIGDGLESPVYWPPPEYHVEYPSGCNLGRCNRNNSDTEYNSTFGKDKYASSSTKKPKKDHQEIDFLDHNDGNENIDLAYSQRLNRNGEPESNSLKKKIKGYFRNKRYGDDNKSEGPSSGYDTRTDSDAYLSSEDEYAYRNKNGSIKINSSQPSSIQYHSEFNGYQGYYSSSSSSVKRANANGVYNKIRMRSANDNVKDSDSDENVPLVHVARKLASKEKSY
ncbi:hypothetical protein AYI70_g11306 [Smittium culicis]|uniref:Uncharacterized protein n=1 Tax=Smittium culicis TaxID=133412 RepID=A0A1R1X2J6_9FUNG|nr:hypothetical protein AYI70_g11306 [Smittium culicis]